MQSVCTVSNTIISNHAHQCTLNFPVEVLPLSSCSPGPIPFVPALSPQLICPLTNGLRQSRTCEWSIHGSGRVGLGQNFQANLESCVASSRVQLSQVHIIIFILRAIFLAALTVCGGRICTWVGSDRVGLIAHGLVLQAKFNVCPTLDRAVCCPT